MFWGIWKTYNRFTIGLKQSKQVKMRKNEIPPLYHIALEFFCLSLYTDCLSDLRKMFQGASSYDAYLKYQM